MKLFTSSGSRREIENCGNVVGLFWSTVLDHLDPDAGDHVSIRLMAAPPESTGESSFPHQAVHWLILHFQTQPHIIYIYIYIVG